MYLYRVTDTQEYRQYTDTQHAMLTHKNKPIPTYMRKKCKYKTSNAQTKEKNTEKTVHHTTTQAMITYRKQMCVKNDCSFISGLQCSKKGPQIITLETAKNHPMYL